MGFGLRWYALMVETGWETIVRDKLTGDLTDVHLAIEEVVMHRAGRRLIEREVPFIPGYVLIRDDLGIIGTDWVKGLRGAITLVRGASPKATPIADDVVAALRELEDHDGLIRPKRALARIFARHQEVRATGDEAGPWAGLVGRILTMRGPERAHVLFGSTKVTLTTKMLVPA